MEQVYNSRENYRDKDGASNWSQWASRNPGAGKYLAALETEIEENG